MSLVMIWENTSLSCLKNSWKNFWSCPGKKISSCSLTKQSNSGKIYNKSWKNTSGSWDHLCNLLSFSLCSSLTFTFSSLLPRYFQVVSSILCLYLLSKSPIGKLCVNYSLNCFSCWASLPGCSGLCWPTAAVGNTAGFCLFLLISWCLSLDAGIKLTCFREDCIVLTGDIAQWLSQLSVACTSNFALCVLVITRGEKEVMNVFHVTSGSGGQLKVRFRITHIFAFLKPLCVCICVSLPFFIQYKVRESLSQLWR